MKLAGGGGWPKGKVRRVIGYSAKNLANTHLHSHTYVYTHTYVNTYTHIHTHTLTCTYTYKFILSYALTIYVSIYVCIINCIQIYTYVGLATIFIWQWYVKGTSKAYCIFYMLAAHLKPLVRLRKCSHFYFRVL